TPIVLRNGHLERRVAISGVPRSPDLSRILDDELRPVDVPPVGLLISRHLAKLLDLRTGDQVEVELLEKDGRVAFVPVTAIVESYIGLAVYMRAEALDRLLGDGPPLSGAHSIFHPARV